MSTYVPKATNSGDLEPSVIPPIVSQELSRLCIGSEAEAFAVRYFRTDVLEELLADLHCVDVSGLMVGPMATMRRSSAKHLGETLAWCIRLSHGLVRRATMVMEKGQPCGREALS